MKTRPEDYTAEIQEFLDRSNYRSSATVNAVMLSDIPLLNVTAIGFHASRLVIEFDGFNGMPAGCASYAEDRWHDLPAWLKPTKSFNSIDPLHKSIRPLAEEAFMGLLHEGTLHTERFLGAEKDTLREFARTARPLEFPPSFLAYSPDDFVRNNISRALLRWVGGTKEGREFHPQFAHSVAYRVADMMYCHYRDEYRAECRAELRSAIANTNSDRLLSIMKKAWGPEAVAELTAPAARPARARP